MKQGWEYKKLGEVCYPKNKIQRATKCFDTSDKILYIDISSIDNTIQKMTDVISVTFGDAPSRAQQKVEYGDIIVSTVRPNLKNIAIIDRYESNLVASSGFCVLRNTEHVERNYLFYYITSDLFTQHLMKLTTGANYPAVRDQDVRDLIIPLPPKSTQLTIVSELDKINELIRLKKEQLKDYDNLAQSIFYEMFGDPVENEKGWEVKKMKDVCTHIVDCPHFTPKKADTTTNYPCIRTSELKGGTISWSTMQYLEKDEYEKRIARLKPETGDIIFGREGTIGDAVILPSGYNFSLGQRTMLIRTDNEMIINTFMHRTLMSEWIKHQIEYVNVSSTVAHVNIKDFKLFDVPLPPLPLQHLFAQRIEQIERQKSAVQQSITDLETLLASRMQYWFE